MNHLNPEQRKALLGLMHLNSQTDQGLLDWLRSLTGPEMAAFQRDVVRTVERFKGKTPGLDTLLRLGQAKFYELSERINTEQQESTDAA